MQAEGHAALSLCISNKMEACWALYNGVPPLTFVPQHDGKPQLSQETWCIIYVKLWTEMLFSILYKYIYYSSKHSDWFCQVTVRRNFPAIFKKRTVDAASINSEVRCWFLHAVNHGTNRHGPSPLPVAAWKPQRAEGYTQVPTAWSPAGDAGAGNVGSFTSANLKPSLHPLRSKALPRG